MKIQIRTFAFLFCLLCSPLPCAARAAEDGTDLQGEAVLQQLKTMRWMLDYMMVSSVAASEDTRVLLEELKAIRSEKSLTVRSELKALREAELEAVSRELKALRDSERQAMSQALKAVREEERGLFRKELAELRKGQDSDLLREIQALHAENGELAERMDSLRAENKGLVEEMRNFRADLEVLRLALERTLNVVSASSPGPAALEDRAALRREIASLRSELASVREALSGKGADGDAQKPVAGTSALRREAEAAERSSQIVSLLRTMKSAALMYWADSMDAIMEDPAGFREKVNRDPLAVRNVLGKYLEVPATFDESCHFYLLKDDQWLVGYDLTSEDELVLEKLAARARQPGSNLVNVDQSIWNGSLVICMKVR